jgi:hypothetical protein
MSPAPQQAWNDSPVFSGANPQGIYLRWFNSNIIDKKCRVSNVGDASGIKTFFAFKFQGDLIHEGIRYFFSRTTGWLKGHEALCTGLRYQQQKDKSNVKSPYHGIKVADLLEKGKKNQTQETRFKNSISQPGMKLHEVFFDF